MVCKSQKKKINQKKLNSILREEAKLLEEREDLRRRKLKLKAKEVLKHKKIKKFSLVNKAPNFINNRKSNLKLLYINSKINSINNKLEVVKEKKIDLARKIRGLYVNQKEVEALLEIKKRDFNEVLMKSGEVHDNVEEEVRDEKKVMRKEKLIEKKKQELRGLRSKLRELEEK